MKDLRDVLTKMKRSDAEGYFSETTRSQFLGNNTLLCQVLGGRKLFTVADDVGFTPHMIFDGYWEFWLSKYFALAIHPGDAVLDIGANQGYYTILAGDLVGPEGKVIAIEPNPEVHSRLVSSAQVNGFGDRVEARNVAVSLDGQAGAAQFWVPHGDSKNARFFFPGDDRGLMESLGHVIEVEAVRLDVDSFERVDFVKVDVEGAELSVLQQLRPIIEKFRPGLVCEVNFERHYKFDDLVEAIGSEKLLYLDYDSKVKPFTRDMAEDQATMGDDWLVCLERGG